MERTPTPDKKQHTLGVTDDTILPCPFCGHRPIWTHLAVADNHFHLRCENCQFEIRQDRRDKVIGMWNARTISLSQLAQAKENSSLKAEFEMFKKNTAFREDLSFKNRDEKDAEIERLKEKVELYEAWNVNTAKKVLIEKLSAISASHKKLFDVLSKTVEVNAGLEPYLDDWQRENFTEQGVGIFVDDVYSILWKAFKNRLSKCREALANAAQLLDK